MKSLIFIIVICLVSIQIACELDFSKKYTVQNEVVGIVCNKYKDKYNHSEPTIIYSNQDGEFKYLVSDWAIRSDFWEYLEIGDSVIKPSGTLIFRIKKPDGEYKDYKYQR